MTENRKKMRKNKIKTSFDKEFKKPECGIVTDAFVVGADIDWCFLTIDTGRKSYHCSNLHADKVNEIMNALGVMRWESLKGLILGVRRNKRDKGLIRRLLIKNIDLDEWVEVEYIVVDRSRVYGGVN